MKPKIAKFIKIQFAWARDLKWILSRSVLFVLLLCSMVFMFTGIIQPYYENRLKEIDEKFDSKQRELIYLLRKIKKHPVNIVRGRLLKDELISITSPNIFNRKKGKPDETSYQCVVRQCRKYIDYLNVLMSRKENSLNITDVEIYRYVFNYEKADSENSPHLEKRCYCTGKYEKKLNKLICKEYTEIKTPDQKVRDGFPFDNGEYFIKRFAVFKMKGSLKSLIYFLDNSNGLKSDAYILFAVKNIRMELFECSIPQREPIYDITVEMYAVPDL